jgi:hypothetical protein
MRAVILSLGLALLLCASSAAQFCDPPGEYVGTTSYPLQSLESSTNRISIDSEGWISVVWTQDLYGGRPRFVYCNFRDGSGQWSFEGGSRVAEENGTGFPTVALMPDDRLAVTYHSADSYPGSYIRLAIDQVRGFGIFTEYSVPDTLPDGNDCLWPRVAVSASGDIHILMRESRDGGYTGNLAYTRSEDGGADWTAPATVDSVSGYSASITAAPDGKVAIVYPRPNVWENSYGFKNDVCYFSSADGREWDFSEPINITDYENDDLDIYYFGGLDAVYDFQGYLNVIWSTGHFDEVGNPLDDAISLWHYSERNGGINLASEMTDPDVTCEMPGLQISMPTMSVDSQGDVEIIYAGYVDTDVSSEGDCVGDLYMVFGTGFGETWYGPYNITATHSPGCLPGECQSEGQQSTAEVMADSVHLTYLMQKLGDNRDTVFYMPVAVPYWLSADDTEDIPTAFRLRGNYPNPFNSRTLIEFETVGENTVSLNIYDISGALVETLYEGRLESGPHSIAWNAESCASGVYYYRLSAGSDSQVGRMVLLK